MTTYRTRTGGHDVHPPVTEQFLEETSSLARKFGVEGGLGLNEERLHEEDTVEEELGRYMRSALRSNCKDDILKFWAVSVHNFVYVNSLKPVVIETTGKQVRVSNHLSNGSGLSTHPGHVYAL